MKKVLYRLSVIFPLILIYYSFTEPVSFSIPELGVYLEPYMARFIIVMLAMLWLCCSPYKKSCCNGTWIEVLYNLVPVEIVMMLNLAQWHFTFFAIIGLILVLVEMALFIGLRRDEHKHRITKKSHRKYKTIFRRCTVLAISAICVVSCSPSLFSHGLTSPTYQAEQEIWRLLFSDSTEADDAAASNNDVYQENPILWHCLEDSTWKSYSIPEKITVMQRLTDFETEILGIPSITITADLIGAYTLGSYSDETNEILVNTKYLDSSPVEECINTICHEVRHSLQFQIVSSIDWDNPIFQTSYFDELQSWFQNQENYKSAWLYGFEEYENQPLEVDARDYAERETEKIMSYVHGGVQ